MISQWFFRSIRCRWEGLALVRFDKGSHHGRRAALSRSGFEAPRSRLSCQDRIRHPSSPRRHSPPRGAGAWLSTSDSTAARIAAANGVSVRSKASNALESATRRRTLSGMSPPRRRHPRRCVPGQCASRNISPIYGSFGRQDAVIVGRTDRETLKGEPEPDEAPVALRPGERASQGWLAPACKRSRDCAAQQVAEHYVEAA